MNTTHIVCCIRVKRITYLHIRQNENKTIQNQALSREKTQQRTKKTMQKAMAALVERQDDDEVVCALILFACIRVFCAHVQTQNMW